MNPFEHKAFLNSENHKRFDLLKNQKNSSASDKDFASKYLSSHLTFIVETNLNKIVEQHPNKKIAFEKTKLEILGKLNEEIFGKN